MASIRKSLALSLAERYSGILISIAGTVILARLLSPAQIGVYSVAASFVGLAYLSPSNIYESHITISNPKLRSL